MNLAGDTGSAFARNHDSPHAPAIERVIDLLLTVAAIGGHSPRLAVGAGYDAFYCRGQLWAIGRVSRFDGVVYHNPVVVVGDLRFVAELDRLAQSALS